MNSQRNHLPSTHTRTGRRLAAVALAVSIVALAAGCGDESDDDAIDAVATTHDHDGSDTTVADTTVDSTVGGATDDGPSGDPSSVDSVTGEDLTEACAQYTQISAALGGALSPDELAPVLEAFAAAPPTRLVDAAPIIADGLNAMFAGDEAAMSDGSFVSSLGVGGGYLFDTCALDSRLEVTGADYTFDGIEPEIDAGAVGIRFTNLSAGAEPHELLVVRRPEGDERTTDEIASLGPDVLFAEYEMVAVAWADVPSASMSVLVDLAPGDYLALCTLPIDGAEETTHLHAGMIAEFTAA